MFFSQQVTQVLHEKKSEKLWKKDNLILTSLKIFFWENTRLKKKRKSERKSKVKLPFFSFSTTISLEN